MQDAFARTRTRPTAEAAARPSTRARRKGILYPGGDKMSGFEKF